MSTDAFATMDDAHREWHRNTGIPMGTPGCPQDACHPVEDEAYGDPACPICEGTGWDEAFGNACDCAAHLAAGGARRMQHQRTIAVGGAQDRIHTPGESLNGRYGPKAKAPKADEPVTERQQAFALSLIRSLYEGEKLGEMLGRWATKVDTKAKASVAIDKMVTMRDARKAQAQQAPAAAPVVPAAAPVAVEAGHYAVTNANGVLSFYEVDCPTQGKWAGRTFVSVQASDDFHPVKGAAGQAVLAKIALDPHAAAAAYGQHIGRCGYCHRTLTRKYSRDMGYGPTCADLHGLHFDHAAYARSAVVAEGGE